MSRWKALALGVVIMAGLAGPSMATATELYAEGTQQRITGAEDFGRTLLHYAITLGLPALGVVLGGSGFGQLGTRPGMGATKIGSGIGACYLPAMIRPGQEYAAGATSLWEPLVHAGWADITGMLIAHAMVAAVLICRYRWQQKGRAHVAPVYRGV